MNSLKPLYKYLGRKKGRVDDLVTKAYFLGKMNQDFLKFVPTPLNQHVQLANLNGKILHVNADSPAWAAKFRFMSSHLIPTLNKNIKQFQYVKEFSVATRPLAKKLFTSPRNNVSRHLSSAAKDSLLNMAESMVEGDLKKSLLRLANRHKTVSTSQKK